MLRLREMREEQGREIGCYTGNPKFDGRVQILDRIAGSTAEDESFVVCAL